MFKSKPSKSGFIYKMIENVLRVFNGGKKGSVANTKCGFFAQGVSCGVFALYVLLILPVTLTAYYAVIGEIIFGVKVTVPSIYASTITAMVFAIPPAIIGLLAGMVTLLLCAGCLILAVAALIVYLVMVLWTGSFVIVEDNELKQPARVFRLPIKVWGKIVQFKNKHCKKIEWED